MSSGKKQDPSDANNRTEERVREGDSGCELQVPVASATLLAAAVRAGKKVERRQELTRHWLLN